MAITFRSAGAVASGDNLATITPGAPAGAVPNDRLYACIGTSGAGSTVVITPPAGWTLVKRVNDLDLRMAAVYEAAGDVASYAFGLSATSGADIAFVLAHQAAGALSTDNSNGQVNASSVTLTAGPTFNTANPNEMLVAFWLWSDALGGAAPTFSAEQLTFRASGTFGNLGDTIALDSGSAVQAAAGATGTKTATASIAMPNIGILIALQEAVAGFIPPFRAAQAVPRAAGW